jgi:hypothetical protein
MRYNTTRHDTTRHDTTRHDTTRHDTTRHDTTRHDTTRHDTTRHDTTRHDTIRTCSAHADGGCGCSRSTTPHLRGQLQRQRHRGSHGRRVVGHHEAADIVGHYQRLDSAEAAGRRRCWGRCRRCLRRALCPRCSILQCCVLLHSGARDDDARARACCCSRLAVQVQRYLLATPVPRR